MLIRARRYFLQLFVKNPGFRHFDLIATAIEIASLGEDDSARELESLMQTATKRA
jgi:hypothetical protein